MLDCETGASGQLQRVPDIGGQRAEGAAVNSKWLESPKTQNDSPVRVSRVESPKTQSEFNKMCNCPGGLVTARY